MEHQETRNNFFVETIKFILLALIIVVPIRVFVAQPFIVNGASMDPTFHSGQYLIVDQLSYNFELPKRGEVIIFKYPKDPTKFFIKRVVGLPLETVELRGKDVIIKNSEHESGFILDEPYLKESNRSSFELTTTLESDEYFVLGDNRRASSDSRFWGPVERDLFIGKAFLRLFPINTISTLPGNYSESYQ